jgi:predicted ATPase
MKHVNQFLQIWTRITGWAIKLFFEIFTKLINSILISLLSKIKTQREPVAQLFEHPEQLRFCSTFKAKGQNQKGKNRYRSKRSFH